MSLQLAGRNAVVTGAGRGLGRVVAEGLAAAGCAVAVVARSPGQVDETVHVIRRAGGRAIGVVGDISDVGTVTRLRDEIHHALGPVTILVNAAGVFGPIQPIEDGDPRRWIETLLINTIGPYLTCRSFVPDMRAAGWGRIVNFSSAATLHPPGPLNSAYGTSKVALNQFTRHLAAELAGSNVTAHVIHPGEVKTAMWAAIDAESRTAGPQAAGYRAWAEGVGVSGGDDPRKALELVLDILRNPDPGFTGRFLWIEGGQQTPLASW